MILSPPKNFDANEWFIILSILVNGVIIYLLPKKFPASSTILFLLLGLSLAKNLDFILVNPPYDMYDINDDPKNYEWMDVLIAFVYCPFSYYLLYIYEKWKFKRVPLFIFIFLTALFSIGFEYLGILLGVFHYKQWNLMLSFQVYLISICVTLLFYHWIAKKREQTLENR